MIRTLPPIPAACRRKKAAGPAPLSEQRFRGPHWGGFWPEEFTPDLDAVYVELAAPKGEAGSEHHAACIDRKEGPFDVCYSDGRIVRTFDDRWRAIGQLNRYPLAAFVLQAGVVVARREDADVHLGDRVSTDPAEALVACGKDGEL